MHLVQKSKFDVHWSVIKWNTRGQASFGVNRESFDRIILILAVENCLIVYSITKAEFIFIYSHGISCAFSSYSSNSYPNPWRLRRESDNRCRWALIAVKCRSFPWQRQKLAPEILLVLRSQNKGFFREFCREIKDLKKGSSAVKNT